MNLVALDIETNLAHDTIWCCGVVTAADKDIITGTPELASKVLQGYIDLADIVIGHNLIEFDIPLLEKYWGVTIPKHKVRDTLLTSRLWNPRIEGGHSLKAWGLRLGEYKDEFALEDFDKGFTDEMAEYCLQDCKVTMNLHQHLTDCFKRSNFSADCIDLEHDVQWITAQQVRNGFKLDIGKATSLYQDLWIKMIKAQDELQQIFPPVTIKRVSEKTGKALKDKIITFNPSSRQQIAERLISKGVKLVEQTEKGAWKIDETVLGVIDTKESRLLLDYFLCQKRTGQIDQWLSHVKDNRVHGRVSTNGAVTGRMTHFSPNLAQIPSTKAPYGRECRECWIVDKGNVLVGIDAAGLELRMLAHYLDDEYYTTTLVEYDIHLANMHSAGLSNREQAKTFIYAFIYGAGVAKLGSIIGGNASTGRKAKARFLKANPLLKALIVETKTAAKKGSIIGLDGRKIRIASEHAALNSLLQSAGAIVMKRALVILVDLLESRNIPFKIVANVHDEIQIEVSECFGNAVGRLGCKAIVEAGLYYKLNCPLAGDYNAGQSWAETH